MKWTRYHDGKWFRWFAWYPVGMGEWGKSNCRRVWLEWVERRTYRLGPWVYHDHREIGSTAADPGGPTR